MGPDILCTVTLVGTLPTPNRNRPGRGVCIKYCRVQSFRALDTRAQDLRCNVNDSPIFLRHLVMFRTDSVSEYSCCYRTFLRTVVATQHDGQSGRIGTHSITSSRVHRSEGISSARSANSQTSSPDCSFGRATYRPRNGIYSIHRHCGHQACY